MRVLQINAVYNQLSTGRTTTELHNALLENGIDSFCAFAQSNVEGGENLYRIGTPFDRKLHAFLSRLSGKQAYFSKGATKKLHSHGGNASRFLFPDGKMRLLYRGGLLEMADKMRKLPEP